MAGRIMEGGRTHCRFRRHEVGISRAPDGSITMDAWGDESNQTGRVFMWPRIDQPGLWAPTAQVINSNLIFTDAEFAESLTTAERASIRRSYADQLAGAGYAAELVAAVDAGEAITTIPLPAGYAHDAAILLIAAAFAYSLYWSPTYFRMLSAANRRAAARAAGLCPACRYDLRGLRAGGTCPECGAHPAPCAICGHDLSAFRPEIPCPECGTRR